MLIQLQKVPLVPHEFLKLSHKLVQPKPLNLVLLHILLPQWTVLEIVSLKCKQKKRGRRRDSSTKSWQCQFWRFWIHSLGCLRTQRRENVVLRVNKMLCFTYTHRYNTEIVWGKLRPVLIAYLKNPPLTSPPVWESVHTHSIMSDSLRPHGLLATRLLCPQDFSWQEYWTGLPFPSPGDLQTQGSTQTLLSLQHWQVGSFDSDHCSLMLVNPLSKRWASQAQRPFYLFPVHLVLDTLDAVYKSCFSVC